MGGCFFDWKSITGDVPHGLQLGHLLFVIWVTIVDGLEDRIQISWKDG